MLPSLKTSYEAKLQKQLQEYKTNPEILREVIDQSMIDEMDRALAKLSNVLKGPELESLDSFHLGMQKAHDELSDILSYGDLRKWAHSLLPKGFTALGRLAAFTSGITRLLKQLPKIINIVKGSMGTERRAEWDPNKPMDQLLDDKATQKLVKIIVNAMKPPSGLSGLSSGLPYVKDDVAAAELLGLSFNQLSSFSAAASKIDPPPSQAETSELGHDIKSVARALFNQAEESGEEQIQSPPQKSPAQTPKLELPNSSEPEQKVMTVADARQALLSTWDDEVVKTLGIKGPNSKHVHDLKPRMLKAIMLWMISNGLIVRTPKP